MTAMGGPGALAAAADPRPERPVNARPARSEVGGPCYVYGIVPAAVRTRAALRGLGDEQSRVAFVRYRRVAAAISGVPADRPLGTPADLRAHAAVLGALARSVAVLPMRFGSVLPDEDAVVARLLEPQHVTFAARLDELRGHAQFTVKGRYLGDVALREILAEEPEILRLRTRLQGRDLDVYRGEGIRLGQLVARALERKRAADAKTLTTSLGPHVAAVAERPPASPDIAADAAFLVARPHRRGFEEATEELGRRWQGRVRLSLMGPLALYDFAQPLDQRGMWWDCSPVC